MMRSTLALLVGLAVTACAPEPPAVPLPDKNTTVGKSPNAGTTTTSPSGSSFPTSGTTTPTIPAPQTTSTGQAGTPTGGKPADTTTGTGGTTTPPPAGGTTTPSPSPTPSPTPEAPKPTVSAFWSAASDGKYPTGAVTGGAYGGESALVCRVKTSSGGYAPGTLLPSEGVCFYTVGAAGAYSAQYEVLAVSGGAATSILSFLLAANGGIPARSVKGGDSNGRPVAVCSVSTAYGVAYGQIGAGDPGCVFYGMTVEGKAVAVYQTSYWVLAAK